MAKKKSKADPETNAAIAQSRRPRLHKLRVSNFRCIGNQPIEVELDDIVVLVGPNNVGKTSILRAYEVVMLHGSKHGELINDDFPNGKVDPMHPPTIELETVVFDKTAPGERWVRTDHSSSEMFVREKWTWSQPGPPKKVGWDVGAAKWHDSEGPWGAANVAQARRPEPHRVGAFDSPEKQAEEIAKLLKEALAVRVKELSKAKPGEQPTQGQSNYAALLETIKRLQTEIASDAKTAVTHVEDELTKMINDVFPGYAVTFDARAEDDIEKAVNLFKADPIVRMGPTGGHQTTIDRQGSGARRTLLWTALRILSEQRRPKGEDDSDRPHVLLMDEPEICLHPDAIREACKVLYDLPKTGNWQVMITTHSPVFIDFTRDNTSIVRVERTDTTDVRGTTIFRPNRAHLNDDDRARLKMLNLCDPYVAEFFFGGRTIIVEGDTEYTAFGHVAAQNPSLYRGVHVVRARGKASIISLCKILNQFNSRYSILHDSDRPTVLTRKAKKQVTNPAWSINSKILDVVKPALSDSRARLVASIPNFEEAFFGEEAEDEKPYSALEHIRRDGEAFKTIGKLLHALIDHSQPLPDNALSWGELPQLEARVAQLSQQQKSRNP